MEPGKIGSQRESHEHATTIDSLADNVLLDIFELIRSSRPAYKMAKNHFCVSIPSRPPTLLHTRKTCHGLLDCWPPTFPIAVDYGYSSEKHLTPDDEDNMFTTLEIREIRERIRRLRLSMTDGVLVEVINLMQEPFPELRNLAISSYPGWDTRGLDGPSLPNDFLGKSAPSLREISFNGIRFPALPTLLSSASDLVKLTLVNIPNTTYFPPAAFAACLASDPNEPTIAIQLLSDEEIDQLVNIMARALNQTSTMLSDVVRLEITFDRDWKLDDDETVHDIEWLELFRPFTAVIAYIREIGGEHFL
ncbi:hypothetical protein H4582DRAFT_2101691 [Lactarius indigo]|nr:hypothetical protein H4582DRAFT_2101691 [Lactarius indigo]